MVDIQVGIRINRPVEQVFAYMADLTNDPAWHTDVLEAQRTTEGSLGVGTTYHLQLKPSMGVSEGIVEIVDFQPNSRVVLRGEMGRMKPTVTYRLKSADGSTDVTRRVQIDLHGPMRLMQPLVQAMGRKRNARFLVNLKKVLEEE